MFMKRNKARHFLLFNQCMAFVLELLCYIIHILSLIIRIRYVSKSLFSVFNHVWTVPMNTEILKVFESLKFSVFKNNVFNLFTKSICPLSFLGTSQLLVLLNLLCQIISTPFFRNGIIFPALIWEIVLLFHLFCPTEHSCFYQQASHDFFIP